MSERTSGEGPFGGVFHRHPRAQAIEDGTLVDVTLRSIASSTMPTRSS